MTQGYKILSMLISSLDFEMRQRVTRRYESFLYELEIYVDVKKLNFLRSYDWTNERLLVVCELISFYQVVLGVIRTVSMSKNSIFTDDLIAIQWGKSLKYDKTMKDEYDRMCNEFFELISECNLDVRYLESATFTDLVNKMYKKYNIDSVEDVL